MVNKSIAYTGEPSPISNPGLIGHNLSIVIGLGCASGIIMVILIIAILCLRRQDRTRRDQKYNCRMEALKIMNPGSGTKPGDHNYHAEPGLANGSCAAPDPHLKQQTEFMRNMKDLMVTSAVTHHTRALHGPQKLPIQTIR